MREIYFFANGHTSPGEISGGDVRFREIVKRIKGFDVNIITSSFGYDIYNGQGIKAAYFLSSNENKKKNVILAYLWRTLRSLFLDLKISDSAILYSISDFLPNVLPALFFKLKSEKAKWVQLIHHLYENPFERKGNNFAINLLGYLSQRLSFFFIKRFTDLVIVVSPLVREQLCDLGFDGNIIVVNYNGVDVRKFRRFDPLDVNYDAVFLGRLNISKGIFDLVEIWNLVTEKRADSKLALIGGGDDTLEKEMKQKVSNYNLERNFDVLGYLEDEDAFGIVKSSKIFVFPSYEEGFGIAPLEAQACCLPVIAWDLPVFDEIFPDGMVKVSKGSIGKFSCAVLELLENPGKRLKLAKKAYKNALKYDWGSISENEYELLRDL